MRMWATMNQNGATNLFRGTETPEPTNGCYLNRPETRSICFQGRISELACSGLKCGECREIKSIDLFNWTVEHVPNPPTLKEAWEEYRMLNRQSLSCCGTARDLFDALQREFPDE